jgi:nucleoside-diphosphate-sugar epimerase
MAQTALVVGGTGYVGQVLIDEFLHHGIRCVNGDIVPPQQKLCAFELLDIRKPLQLADAIRTYRPDIVINTTAAVPLIGSVRLFEETNIGGCRNLLQASLDAHVPKYIHISTCGIFGIPQQVPITEETPHTPIEAYGRSKSKGEAIVEEFVDRGLDATILRPRSMMGYRRLGIFHVAFELIRCGKSMWTFGPGTNKIQFLHVRDFVRAAYLASQRAGPALYNVGAERFNTLKEDLQELANRAGTGSNVRAFPYWLAVAGMRFLSAVRLSPVVPYQFLLYGHDIYFDVSRIKKELGWSSEYSNVDMMVESYDWYVKHYAELKHDSDSSVQRIPMKLGLIRLLKYLPI